MYKTGIIYKIVCDLDESFCYIGSTTSSLSDRFCKHKYEYKTKRNIMCIHPYFDKYGVENFKIIEIKKYLVCDKHHLWAYELLHMLNNKCINSRKPFNPLYKIEIKPKKKIYHKKYRDENKEKISQDKKLDYEKNRDKILDRVTKYRNENKEIIKKKKNKKITCECGSIVQNSNMARHKKSEKHQNYISRANMVSN